MPCFSTISATKMTDHARIGEALKALGYTDIVIGERAVTARKQDPYTILELTRESKSSAFVANVGKDVVNEIQRKYSELGVRSWARDRGFAVQMEGSKLTLVNRRG